MCKNSNEVVSVVPRDPDILILAAGNSSRYERPKQLAVFDGEPLIRRALRNALAVGPRTVHVVLGAHREKIEPVIDHEPVEIVVAKNWREGLSASLRAGLGILPEESPGVLVMLADQVQVTSTSLRKLLRAWRIDREAIVASSYGGTIGVPAIFPSRVYAELLLLEGKHGAKSLIRCDSRVVTVPMPEAAADIDYPRDLPPLAGRP